MWYGAVTCSSISCRVRTFAGVTSAGAGGGLHCIARGGGLTHLSAVVSIAWWSASKQWSRQDSPHNHHPFFLPANSGNFSNTHSETTLKPQNKRSSTDLGLFKVKMSTLAITKSQSSAMKWNHHVWGRGYVRSS